VVLSNTKFSLFEHTLGYNLIAAFDLWCYMTRIV